MSSWSKRAVHGHATSAPTTTAAPTIANSKPQPNNATAPFPAFAPAVAELGPVKTVAVDGAEGALVAFDGEVAVTVPLVPVELVPLVTPELVPLEEPVAKPEEAVDTAAVAAAEADTELTEGTSVAEVVETIVVVDARAVVVDVGAPGAEICIPFPIVFTFAH